MTKSLLVRRPPAVPAFMSEPAAPARNCLLGLLPPAEAERLAPFLHRCDAPLDEVLGAPDRPMEFVYFPESSVGSVINLTDDGFVEVGTVGNEGMVGLSVLLDAEALPLRTIWQVAGTAMRMRAADVRPLFDELPTFRSLLLRYAHAFLVQVAQTAACNRKHDLDQRCARWLLMTHDRVASDTFGLTQRLLGVMLGVHRPAATVCARTLQRAGLITYTRGSITIVDRQGLEAASCECYVIVRDHFSRLCRTAA